MCKPIWQFAMLMKNQGINNQAHYDRRPLVVSFNSLRLVIVLFYSGIIKILFKLSNLSTSLATKFKSHSFLKMRVFHFFSNKSNQNTIKLRTLQESEERYRVLVENSSDFIYEVTYNGLFLYASQSLQNRVGINKSEFDSLNFMSLVREDYRTQLAEYYANTVKERKTFSYYEFPVIARSGEEIWFGQTGNVVFDENYRVVRFQYIARDLTEVRKLNESNDRQRRMLSAILQSAKDGISVMVFKHQDYSSCALLQWEMANLATNTLFGQESVIGLTFFDVLPNESATLLNNWCLEAIHLKQKCEKEFNIQLKNGRRWLHITSVSVTEGLVVTISDITVERMARQEIQEQKNFYETILNNMPSEVAVFSPDRRYLFVNPAAVKSPEMRTWLIGKTDEEYATFKGRSYDKSDQRLRLFNEAVVERKAIAWEDAFELPDARTKTFLRHYYPIEDPEGNIYFVVGNGIEITRLKEIEADLEKARNLAEQSALARQVFINTMSHEMRTPLNCVIGLSHLLLDENPKDEQVENLKAMLFSAKNLLALINDVLDFGKLEAGKVGLEKIPFRLVELLQSIYSTFKHQALQKGINLSLTIGDHVPKQILSDSVRLTQVITNLLNNALKFTSEGSVSLKVEMVQNLGNQAMLSFSIEDTGIGIPAEKQQDIFESFTQAESHTTRLYGGTGLGLSITKRLLELFGSQISLKSEHGVGSLFSFEILVEVENAPIESTLKINGQEYPIAGKKVLLVEDNEINRLVANKFLKKWGVVTHNATNGQEALELVKKEAFDVVLMDIQMPVMDGYTAAKHIRQLPGCTSEELPIIALTATISEEVIDDVRFSTMNKALPKPLDPTELYNCLLFYSVNSTPIGEQHTGNE
jgi:PAS domain S-box-containing protein